MKDITLLKENIAKIKADSPKLRARDLAKRAGISEAELLSLSVGENVTRLEGDWKDLLSSFKSLGYIMALTRNEYCVHEHKGVYDNVTFYGGGHNMGVAVNPDIDLRFFMNEWHYGFAVEMPRGANGILYGFQFFNKKGEAIHKVYSTPKTDLHAFKNLVHIFRAEAQTRITDIDKSALPAKEITPDSTVDIPAFQEEWRNLKDTHDFFGLLRKYKLQRMQALRLGPDGFTQKVDNDVVIRVLVSASETGTSIMCFLHSKGCIQIHTGEIKHLKTYGEWYNIMDPKFNLHLNLSGIAESWVVKKPTADGIVTSLELFDENGDLITYFFGERKPGKPELEAWREIIEEAQGVKI